MSEKEIVKFIPDEIYAQVMKSLPIATVDVLIFTPDMSETLLFYRENKPIIHVYCSLGGRLFKNETLKACATRKIKQEVGLDVDKAELVFAGSINEIYDDSAFEGTNAHTVNNFFYIVRKKEDLNIHFDTQHSKSKWFNVTDETLHPYMKDRIKQCLEKAKH